VADINRQTSPADFEAALADIVDQITQTGAVAVLHTLPVKTIVVPKDKKEQDKADARTKTMYALSESVSGYNDAVKKVAQQKGVPFVDAWRIVNLGLDAKKKPQRAVAPLTKADYEAVNERFLRLYRVLERGVMGRGVAIPRVAGNETVAGKPETGGTPVAASGNLVKNGGFETDAPQGTFPLAWNKFVGGDKAVACLFRVDKITAHGGARAMLIRASGDGAEPSLITSLLSVPKGTYTLSCWAMADIDGKARIHMSLGGEEITPVTVGEDWQQVSGTVSIAEDQKQATVRVWTTTDKLKVWFDDVVVARTGK
jgi:hypothetical protein